MPNYVGSLKKQESSRKISTSALLTTSRTLTVWITANCGKFLNRWEYLRNRYGGQEATARTDMKQQTGSKSGKEYIKVVYCHPAYLTYMQSTCWEMLGWMKHKLKSRFPGEISITSHKQMAQSEEELRSFLKVKEESEKVGLKLNIQKTKIMVSGPFTSWVIDGETMSSERHYLGELQNHCRWWLQPWN